MQPRTASVAELSTRSSADSAADIPGPLAFIASVLQTIPGLVFVWDAEDRRCVLNNQRVAEFFGLSASQCQDLPHAALLSRVHPEDQTIYAGVLTRLLKLDRGEIDRCEYRLRNHAGEYQWMFQQTQVSHWIPSGRAKYLVATATLIDALPNEFDRTTSRTRESELRYRTLFETIEDAVVLIDETGTILEANPAVTRLFGYSNLELLGANIGTLIPEPHRSRHPQYLQRYLDTGSRRVSGSSVEQIARRKDGRLFPIRLSLGEMELNGELYFTGMIQNLSERAQAERERRELAEIVEKSGDCVAVLSLDGLVQYLNPLGLKFIGREALEQVRGVCFSEFLQGEDARRFRDELIPEVLRSGIATGELQLKSSVSNSVESLASMLFLLNDEITGQPRAIAAVNRVETEKRRLEQQFRQAQKMEAVGRLAGGVAHDFNNLLTVINGYCDLLGAEAMVPSHQRELIHEIHQAGLRAANLTRQLLAFSRNSVVSLSEVHFGKTVASMERMLERLIGEDIRFVIRTDPTLGTVQADSGQIEQVILNLIVNARDAIPTRGTITIETANSPINEEEARRLGACPPGDYVRLSIIDDGCGMSGETKSHLFEPFFTTKGQGKGTGLGLATVFGIVKKFDGFIHVESELAKGTGFHLFFPRLVRPIPTASVMSDSKPPARGKELILLVEDEVSVRRLARLLLQQMGYQVIEAQNGEQALQRVQAKQGKIDLVLTDVVMPELSGRELIDLLRNRYPQIKVLFMSGYTDDEVFRNGVSMDTVAFLQKPFTAESLARKVREVLDNPVSSDSSRF
jgi:PAS domain S-box-containing protein